jgi:hypothetical protein
MKHELYLDIYTFQIKPFKKRNAEIIEINTFLENAYPAKSNKFVSGFVDDIVNKAKNIIKNGQGNMGALFDKKDVNHSKRYFDLLLDGGTTGIEQFIIDKDGKKTTAAKENIIGPKFYGRFWLPTGSKTGYIFIQSYTNLSLKPIFDALLSGVLRDHSYTLESGRIKKTTTNHRQKQFMKYAFPKAITVVKKSDINDTSKPSASSIEIKIRGLNMFDKLKPQQRKTAALNALKNNDIELKNDNFNYNITFESNINGEKQERTTTLDSSDDSINLIPRILIPAYCADNKNYPSFDKMKEFIDQEIVIITNEARN